MEATHQAVWDQTRWLALGGSLMIDVAIALRYGGDPLWEERCARSLREVRETDDSHTVETYRDDRGEHFASRLVFRPAFDVDSIVGSLPFVDLTLATNA